MSEVRVASDRSTAASAMGRIWQSKSSVQRLGVQMACKPCGRAGLMLLTEFSCAEGEDCDDDQLLTASRFAAAWRNLEQATSADIEIFFQLPVGLSRRMLQEAEILGCLGGHPNIVQLRCAAVSQQTLRIYIAMQLGSLTLQVLLAAAVSIDWCHA